MSTALPAITRRRGRPRKFAAPSRAVTLTLPESVIATLETVDPDLSRAVVRLAQPEVARQPHPAAEVVTFGHRAVIVVNPTRTLEQRTGVLLLPFPDGRALICFDDAMTTARLELLIRDALDEHDLPEADGQVFEQIRDLLKEARRTPGVSLRQRQVIVLEYGNGPRKRAARARAPRRRGAD